MKIGENYLDPEDPRSVINKVSKSMREAILAIPPEIMELDTAGLEKLTSRGHFTVKEKQIRSNFWAEYHRAVDEGVNMIMTNVFRSVCSMENFYGRIINDPVKIAFFITPPRDYINSLNDLLGKLLEEAEKIVQAPLFDNKGKLDVSVANLKLKLLEKIDNRINGAPTQTINQKNMNLNVTKEIKEIPQMSEIDKKIKELENKIVPQIELIPEAITEDDRQTISQ